jgi:hypothetical protein
LPTERFLAKSQIDGEPGVRRDGFLWNHGRGGRGDWVEGGLGRSRRWSRGGQAFLEQEIDAIDALAAFDADPEVGAQIAEAARALRDRLPDLVVGD